MQNPQLIRQKCPETPCYQLLRNFQHLDKNIHQSNAEVDQHGQRHAQDVTRHIVQSFILILIDNRNVALSWTNIIRLQVVINAANRLVL